MLHETTHTDIWLSLLIGAVLTLVTEATLAFQRYRFNNGVVLGMTLSAVACYEGKVRRKGMTPSQFELALIATVAAALTMLAQQALRSVLH
jgi:hypothetical protein